MIIAPILIGLSITATAASMLLWLDFFLQLRLTVLLDGGDVATRIAPEPDYQGDAPDESRRLIVGPTHVFEARDVSDPELKDDLQLRLIQDMVAKGMLSQQDLANLGLTDTPKPRASAPSSSRRTPATKTKTKGGLLQVVSILLLVSGGIAGVAWYMTENPTIESQLANPHPAESPPSNFDANEPMSNGTQSAAKGSTIHRQADATPMPRQSVSPRQQSEPSSAAGSASDSRPSRPVVPTESDTATVKEVKTEAPSLSAPPITPAVQEPARVWNGHSGRKFVAAFVEYRDGSVILRAKNNGIQRITLKELVAKDRAFVLERLSGKPNANGVTGLKHIVRNWSDSTGKHNVQALCLDIGDMSVILVRLDGTIINVPIKSLCEADQRLMANLD